MKIGILGGGQLARMLIEACYKYGFEFHILSKEKDSPAGQITKFETVGDWNDHECLNNFSRQCDIITLENEFIEYKKIKHLEDSGKTVYPDSKSIKLIQDKFYQKKTLEKIKIPAAEFTAVESKDDILNFAKKNSYPLILKSRTMGYDGKGNIEITSEKEIDNAFEKLSQRGSLMCESFVNFEKEIATQVVRNKSGEIKVYPVVETIQKNHICNLVIASKNKFVSIRNKVSEIAKNIVSELNYTGVMGIEMFLLGDEILVNELAPRVHNSGHYTIEGCYTSQFENHIRAVLNYPLGNAEMSADNSVMINIIGERNGEAIQMKTDKILSDEKIYLHNYGKKKTGIGRKMGHITVLGDELEKITRTAEKCRMKIDI